MYKVYKITNMIDGRIYFGYTSQKLSARFSGHCSESRDTIIARCIKKYGKDSFSMELLYEFDNRYEAITTEVYLISRYETNEIRHRNGIGMNMTDGGEGCEGYRHSEDMKRQFSVTRMGMNTGKDNPRFGIKATDDSTCKRVYQFNLDGELIKIYDSIKDAAKTLGSNRGTISKTCLLGNRTAKGYYLSYHNEFIKPVNKSLTPINRYSIYGEFIDSFQSISDAVNKLGLKNRYSISDCLRNKRKTAHGFIWGYD